MILHSRKVMWKSVILHTCLAMESWNQSEDGNLFFNYFYFQNIFLFTSILLFS